MPIEEALKRGAVENAYSTNPLSVSHPLRKVSRRQSPLPLAPST